jgi:hypothetical protein
MGRKRKNQRFFSFNFLGKNQKGYLQISFAWIFAIIAGIFILFLAIFAVTKFTKTEKEITETTTGKEIEVLLSPLETGFETAKTTLLTMPVETRIRNECNTYGSFGRQIIQLSQKSFNKWGEGGEEIVFSNRYIFSDSVVEGKNFYIFLKPFDFPFKIADLIYLTSSEKTYCFLDPPERIEEELSNLNQKNIFLEECPSNSLQICFNGGIDCDIEVNQASKFVEKGGEIMFFEDDALMYAAIFADWEIYGCQLERLMQRTEQLAFIYHDKASLISNQGCPPEINLFALITAVSGFSSSSSLASIKGIVEDLDRDDFGVCQLW